MATMRRRRTDPANPVTVYAPRMPTSSRLANEHDQNDSFDARLDWFDKYKILEKSIEERTEQKVKNKLLEEQQKKSGQFLKTFLWMQVYSAILIMVLKKMGVL